ncbi:MAG: pyruvate dehydrogenase (acetyl-transferring) E1 component subunit alpha [Hyphomicrobiaceae bacterium]
MKAPIELDPRAASGPTCFLSCDGTMNESTPLHARDTAALVAGYKAMVQARMFDEKAIALQRTGRLGTYASCLGQEAVGVGVAQLMQESDVFLPSFREHAAQLCRGVTLLELFLYWGGDERGSDFAVARRDFPVSIPVASHLLHAVGVALAFKLRGEPNVAVAVAGDGATSKGDFYEAINMAGVWNVPAVFVINNNQWAISVPREEQTAADTLAQKAVAAGLPGEQVDGNDLVAVREAMDRAMSRARAGEGASVLECVTYRLGDHTTADDASRYRDPDQVSLHWQDEPISRLRAYLMHQRAWSKEEERNLIETCRQQIETSSEAYLAAEAQDISEIFTNQFEELPDELRRQKASLIQLEGT